MPSGPTRRTPRLAVAAIVAGTLAIILSVAGLIVLNGQARADAAVRGAGSLYVDR